VVLGSPLRDESIPLVPTEPDRWQRPKQEFLPPIPQYVQEILDGLEQAGEQYHVSTDGKKVYARKDGQWVQAKATVEA